MHPGMMAQGGGMPQQVHPDFYMMQQEGQQRVPPMHMANSQMPQVCFAKVFENIFKKCLVPSNAACNLRPISASLRPAIDFNDGCSGTVPRSTALSSTNVESERKTKLTIVG